MITQAIDCFYRDFTINQTKKLKQNKREFLCTEISTALPHIAIEVTTTQKDILLKYSNIKLLGLLNIKCIYEDFHTWLIVQEDYRQFRISACYQELVVKDKQFILSQLKLLLEEIQCRELPRYHCNLKSLYLIENVLHINIMDFLNEYEHQDLSTFLGTQEQKIEENQISEECPYFEYIEQLLGVEIDKSLGQTYNSYIYVTKTPGILNGVKSQQIVIKSPKLDELDNYLQLTANREIEINEILPRNSYFANCFFYYRIHKKSFLFFEYYPWTLQDYFTSIVSDPDPIPIGQQYQLAYQFAKGLQLLHSFNIIHRDLKPNNIFLTSTDIHRANLKLADFDRSRIIEPNLDSLLLTHLGNTYDYDPPEQGSTNYGFSSDIWQFGIILYQMANKGIYPLKREQTVISEDQYRNDLSKEQIQRTLKRNDTYTWLISECVKYQPNERITLDQFIQELEKIEQFEVEESTRFMTQGSLSPNSKPKPKRMRSISLLVKPFEVEGDTDYIEYN